MVEKAQEKSMQDGSAMALSSSAPASGVPRSKTALISEAMQRLHDVTERLHRLAEEQRSLEEIRDNLRALEKGLARESDQLRQERDHLSRQLESQRVCICTIEQEIRDIKEELPILERRCAENADRGQRLAREIDQLEHELAKFLEKISVTDTTLEHVHDTIARLDHKILIRGLKC
jgi:chromosome segregation ATPase